MNMAISLARGRGMRDLSDMSTYHLARPLLESYGDLIVLADRVPGRLRRTS